MLLMLVCLYCWLFFHEILSLFSKLFLTFGSCVPSIGRVSSLFENANAGHILVVILLIYILSKNQNTIFSILYYNLLKLQELPVSCIQEMVSVFTKKIMNSLNE